MAKESTIDRIVEAIEIQEGALVPGSRPDRNNNPGNLKMGPLARKFGATEKDDQNHAIFPSKEMGQLALRELVSTKFIGQTLRQIGTTYAEDPEWSVKVARIAGLDPNIVVNNDPVWLNTAFLELGTKEAPGFANNPVVQQYYIDAGSGKMPDSVPWCAAFVGAMLFRSGFKSTRLLAARSYLNFGEKLENPKKGCVAVFSRGGSSWAGHVAFYVESLSNRVIRVLGGNQADAVNIANQPVAKLLGYRWPILTL